MQFLPSASGSIVAFSPCSTCFYGPRPWSSPSSPFNLLTHRESYRHELGIGSPAGSGDLRACPVWRYSPLIAILLSCTSSAAHPLLAGSGLHTACRVRVPRAFLRQHCAPVM